MKIGMLRLSGNLTNKNRYSIGNRELIEYAKLLRRKCDVDILSVHDCIDSIKLDDKLDINQYDALIIINDSTNMFGGIEIKSMTTVYKYLHQFKNQIYYMLTDLALPFVNYSEHIKNKPWNNYNDNEFELQNDIIILSQGKNIQTALDIHKKVSVKEVIYLPLHLWKLYADDNKITDEITKDCDLIYGGSFRAGRREKKMEDYFYNKKTLNVKLYGNIKDSQFKNMKDAVSRPVFIGKVETKDVLKTNATSLSTILMGDKNYNNNSITPRFIEALQSNIICFIDNDFDIKHELLPDDFFYVNNGEELETKVNMIKNNDKLYNDLLNKQQEVLKSLYDYDLIENLYKVLLERNINNEN